MVNPTELILPDGNFLGNRTLTNDVDARRKDGEGGAIGLPGEGEDLIGLG